MLLAVAPLVSRATTLQVGPTRPYLTVRAAALAVQAGDLVEVDAGVYPADVATWSQPDVTVRAVGGGRAHLRADGAAEAGKGIWVVYGANFTAENFEFSGASVPDHNGAGIRAQGSGTLFVRNCYFHDNEDGILGGADSMVVEGSIFDHNGYVDGHSHNMYIDHGASFTLRGSYSHRARVGHNVKSRALRNYILYCRIMDEADGTASYDVDLPQGGRSYLVGNVVEKGPSASNTTLVAYALESALNGILEIYAVNNTLVNDKSGGVIFVRLRSGSVLRATNNILYGPGTPWSGGTTTANANYIHPTKDGAPGFQNSGAYDYHLTASSPSGAGGITDAGVAPGVSSTSYDLTPRLQYVYDAQASTRPTAGPLDVGAFELSGATSSDPQARTLGLALYPNPVSEGGTTLVLELPVRQHVRLGVYDVRGRLVALLHDGDMDAGRAQLLWNGVDTHGRRVASGRYVCQLEAGERVIRRSLQLLR